MYRTLQYAILFVVLVLLQVFLFSRIGISIYVHPLVYIAFILLLPIEIAPLSGLLLGLLMGVTMDLFMATAGVNTIALVSNGIISFSMVVSDSFPQEAKKREMKSKIRSFISVKHNKLVNHSTYNNGGSFFIRHVIGIYTRERTVEPSNSI